MTATLLRPDATNTSMVGVNRWRSINEPVEIRRSAIAHHDALMHTISAHRVVSISVFPSKGGAIDGSSRVKLINDVNHAKRAGASASASSEDDTRSKIVGGAVLLALAMAVGAFAVGSSVLAAMAAVLLAFALITN